MPNNCSTKACHAKINADHNMLLKNHGKIHTEPNKTHKLLLQKNNSQTMAKVDKFYTLGQEK